MKYNKKIHIIALFLFFTLYWIILSYEMIAENFPINSMHWLDVLLSEGSGYNSCMLLGTMYPFLFLLLLNQNLNNCNILYLIRMGRNKYLMNTFRAVCQSALSFTFIFTVVQFVFIISFSNFNLLIQANYFYYFMSAYLVYCSFYIMTGLIFVLIKFLLSSQTKALIFTFIIMLTISVIGLVYHRWTPVMELFIYDRLITNSLTISLLFLKIIKFMILSFGIGFISFFIFKEKDITSNESV